MSAQDVAAELREVAARLANMTPILEVVAADVRTIIDDRFENLNTPSGQPWAELSEAALMARARRVRGYTYNNTIGPLREGERRRTARRWTRRIATRVATAVFNAKPLQDTGRLRASITTEVGATSIAFGTNVVYAAAQNFGYPENKMFGGEVAPIPARQYLPISADGTTLEPEDFWREQFQRIERWIVTGEVT